MSTLTLNYRFTLPTYDVPGWDTAMNANLTSIDAILAQFNIGISLQGLWTNSTLYTAGVSVIDGLTSHIWACAVTHTSSASPITFLTDRANNPTFWTDITNPAIPAAQSATNAAASATAAATSQSAAATSATAAAASATTATLAAVTAGENVGRNVMHNGEFTIQQRGIGPFAGVGLTADRWTQNFSTSTISTTLSALVDADRTAIGDEAAVSTLKSVVGGTAGAADFVFVEQHLESVQRYGGKTVTVSFWAKAAAGTPSIGVGAQQNFGTGGSPSTTVNVNAVAVPISTTWTRYTVTLVLPTTIGKTLGSTAGSDYTAIRFWYSSGATNNTVAGGIGVQSPTVSLWGMQTEIATSATPFEKIGYAQQLAQCQRFYQVGNVLLFSYNSAAATSAMSVPLPVTMRVNPSVSFTPGTASNCGTFAFTVISAQVIEFSCTVTALGAFLATSTYTATADI